MSHVIVHGRREFDVDAVQSTQWNATPLPANGRIGVGLTTMDADSVNAMEKGLACVEELDQRSKLIGWLAAAMRDAETVQRLRDDDDAAVARAAQQTSDLRQFLSE